MQFALRCKVRSATIDAVDERRNRKKTNRNRKQKQKQKLEAQWAHLSPREVPQTKVVQSHVVRPNKVALYLHTGLYMCVAWEGGGGYYYINHKLSPPNTQSKLWIWFPAFANFGTTTNAISRCTLVYGRTHVCINICACAHICIACMYMGFRRFFSPS